MGINRTGYKEVQSGGECERGGKPSVRWRSLGRRGACLRCVVWATMSRSRETRNTTAAMLETHMRTELKRDQPTQRGGGGDVEVDERSRQARAHPIENLNLNLN